MNKLNQFFRKFFAIDDDPHKIAAGAALGIFWGIMPGEGVLTSLLTASLLGLNRAGALAGVLASNMWSTLAVLPLAGMIGGALFGENPESLAASFRLNYDLGIKHFFAKFFFLDVALPVLVGFLIASLSIAVGFYLLIYLLLKYKKLR